MAQAAADGSGPAMGTRVVALTAEAFAERSAVGVGALAEVPPSVDLVDVGGPQLVAAWDLLAPGGSVQSIGWTSGKPAVFPPYSTVGPPKSLTSFLIDGEAGADLATVVQLVADGRLIRR